MDMNEVRAFVMAFPNVAESPHHHMSSFRIGGKIFTTVPPGDATLNLFVGDEDRERAKAIDPLGFENLLWGSKVVGLKADLAKADPRLLKELLYLAWSRKAPARLVSEFGQSWMD